ncbi:MAG: glycosyltransferase [Candidatus Gracilibacteria bacterium]|nr:glycosyltransferase [Candidatus Gracilibacteria bacterium]
MNNNIPLISIVIINYNGLKYLKRTIPKIVNLSYKNKEIIIVDNGSKDGSIEYINSLNNVNLIQSSKIREKNYASNLGINNAKGEYILLCDNDLLIVEDNLLENLLNQYNYDNKTGILGLSFVNEFEKKTIGYGNYLGLFYTKEKKSLKLDDLAKLNGIEISFPSGIGFFIKKEIWNKLGGYDDFLKFGGDDSDIGIKSYMFGFKNFLYTKSIQIHIGMSERQDNNKFRIKFRDMFFADLYTMTKNYTKYNLIITIVLYSIFYFIRSIKQSLFRFHIGPFFAFFEAYYLYIKNINYNLNKRIDIQGKRIIKEDIFIFKSIH